MSKLLGKRAVVTGGSAGIGRALIDRLSLLGAEIINLDLQESSLATQQEKVIELRCDVTSRHELNQVTKHIATEWGQIDILIANAGGGSGPLEGSSASTLDEDTTHEVINRNLIGTINTCVAFSPLIRKQAYSKVITMSSYAGVAARAQGTYADYGTSKAAVAMYTRYLARDLGKHLVNVNCIAPGRIATERMLTKFKSFGTEMLVNETALKRLGTVEDCANVMEFLCTELSNYVTGAVIPVDGGAARHPV